MALTSEETVKLYLVLNKMMYKHSELGYVFYTKNRNPDVDSKEFKEMQELSVAIEALLEPTIPLVQGEGNPYPNTLELEGNPLDQHLDYLTLKFRLDPLPYLDFPKETTNFIVYDSEINIGGISLPAGGGPGYYLSKDNNGNLVWEQISFISEFNNI